MVQSLSNLSLMTLARQFWDDNPIRHNYRDFVYLENFGYTPFCTSVATNEYALKFKSIPLPPCLEDEFKLALLEFGKRKFAKERARALLSLPLEPPRGVVRTLQEFLPEYYARSALPDAIMKVPGLRPYFPKRLIAKVFNFSLALIMTNPRDDPSAISKYWASREFRPYQSVFIDNFATIWRGILHGLWRERDTLVWWEHYAIGLLCDRTNEDSAHCQTVYNETIPWFVFEVLSEEQRDKFLALGRSDLMNCRKFRRFFSSIFKHWPWQNMAFDRYFAGREECTGNEISVLVSVRDYKRDEEFAAIKVELLPKNDSFRRRVDEFLKHIFDKRLTKMKK